MTEGKRHDRVGFFFWNRGRRIARKGKMSQGQRDGRGEEGREKESERERGREGERKRDCKRGESLLYIMDRLILKET